MTGKKIMLIETLKKIIEDAAHSHLTSKGKPGDVPPFDLSTPPSKIKGDLASNVTLVLAKLAGESPRQMAEALLPQVSTHAYVKKAEIAGAGFLNFWLTDAAFKAELSDLLRSSGTPAKAALSKEKILLEFVSANPTGPLHVGHGRGAALGDSLTRIFRYLGYDVTAEFYINDSGGQIRNLGFSVEARIKELSGETAAFPEDGYRGQYVVELAREAIAEKKVFKPIQPAQMMFTEEDAAGYASKRILKMIQNDLADFHVQFDQWFRESTLHAKNEVQEVFEFLRKRNHVFDEDGALWFRATDFGDDKDRVLKKANEAPTYFAADIAYHYDKFRRGFTKLVNIWGADHHGYALRLKGAMKALDHDPESLQIVLNQLVSLKGGRLSKRAGDMITLKEVVEEVGRDAARFFFALRSPGAHFEFDLDLAKKQASDNPVFYVQYVHARCVSLFREAEKRGFSTDLFVWQTADFSSPLHEAERAVFLQLMDFDRVVGLCARDCSSHHLTIYLQELAGKYHRFYEHCHVLDENASVRSFRLALVEAIRRRVAKGLELLGVSAPDKL